MLLLPGPGVGQTKPRAKTPGPATEKKRTEARPAELSEEQLPAFAISLVITLANEAKSYSDLALRPRVLAHAADVLWDADNVTARALFKRAWEAAEDGDSQEVTVKTKDNPPAMVTALRRLSGRDLRFEVLAVIARRDQALSEQFLAKLKSEDERRAAESKDKPPSNDSWVVSEAVSRRLQVAGQLLKDGQTDRALEFASPALDQVNVHTIGFLTELRAKNEAAADQRFAVLLARAEVDPLADANTVSGLSSYLFTPGFYATFQPEGGSRWTQPDDPIVAPSNIPAALRDKFFQVAERILLRPLPPGNEDVSSSGRAGKYNVIKRLMPLFEQYAPDVAAALRPQLTELAGGPSADQTTFDSPTLTQGIKPEPTSADVLEQMQSRLDHAKTARERDQIYAVAAAALLAQGDVRARDLADKIEEPARRADVRQFVDFEFLQRAVRRQDVKEAIQLAQTGKLTNTQRAFGYMEVARLLREPEPQRAAEFLEEALREVQRIPEDKPDRAVLLLGITKQFLDQDRVRAWEVMSEVVKAANRVETFTGENVVTFPLMTQSSVKFTGIGGENLSLPVVFRLLAKDDLYGALDLVKGFKNEAPRSTATLAIAAAILSKR